MIIEWKTVPGFGDYEVSNTGLVRSHKWNKVRILVPVINPCGYLRVKFSVHCRQTQHLIHRLVAKTFIPNPKNKPEVNHKDGDKFNNHSYNLEWVTKQENLAHAMATGLHANPAIPIVCVETGEIFPSQPAAAKKLGIHQANISKVINGERPHTSGYTFRKVI